MSTYDRDKVVAAAKEVGIHIDKFGWTTSVPVERMEAFYVIAYDAGAESRNAEITDLREQMAMLRNSVEELIPENPCDTEHQYKVHHRALEALTATEPKP